MATIKLKDESTKTFSIDGVCYTKGDYRLQYNAKKEILIIPKAVANISNLSGLPFKTPTAWTYFVDANDNPYNSFEEFSLAISDAINFNSGEATPQYKVYTALLTQTGTSAPTAIVLENTLGDILLERQSTGMYKISRADGFTINKSIIFSLPNAINGDNVILTDLSSLAVYILSYSLINNIYEDNLLDKTPIEIRVYN